MVLVISGVQTGPWTGTTPASNGRRGLGRAQVHALALLSLKQFGTGSKLAPIYSAAI